MGPAGTHHPQPLKATWQSYQVSRPRTLHAGERTYHPSCTPHPQPHFQLLTLLPVSLKQPGEASPSLTHHTCSPTPPPVHQPRSCWREAVVASYVRTGREIRGQAHLGWQCFHRCLCLQLVARGEKQTDTAELLAELSDSADGAPSTPAPGRTPLSSGPRRPKGKGHGEGSRAPASGTEAGTSASPSRWSSLPSLCSLLLLVLPSSNKTSCSPLPALPHLVFLPHRAETRKKGSRPTRAGHGVDRTHQSQERVPSRLKERASLRAGWRSTARETAFLPSST